MAAPFLWQLDAVSLAPARLCKVTLTIGRGVTAVVGWSGAGKTSLLNVLAGFEAPESGRLRGSPRVAWVPQSGGLWPHCTAQEHLEIVRAAPEEAAALLCALGLGERRDARPHELSQGEQSRLSIARALASPAEVCLMDEPLAHVDPARAPQYWRAIRDRIAAAGASLVFATHSPETVIADANRVICLREGRLLHHGTADALYARPETEELMNFLGAGNWLTPAEAQRWLGLALAAPACLRPEQITIEPAASGAAEVIGARFMGAVAEAELRAADGARRIFFHRPSGPALAAGMRVSLQLARS